MSTITPDFMCWRQMCNLIRDCHTTLINREQGEENKDMLTLLKKTQATVLSALLTFKDSLFIITANVD